MSGQTGNPNLSQGSPICPECGATNFPGTTKCYLCGHQFSEAERVVSPSKNDVLQLAEHRLAPSESRSARSMDSRVLSRGPNTYSLSTLFLAVTVVCVFCGLIAAAPGLGIPLAVLITPALIRSLTAIRIQQSEGVRATVESKISIFFSSLGVMILVLIAAGAAFFAACSVVGFGALSTSPSASAIILAFGAGTFMALVVGVLIMVRTWPRRKNR